MYKIVFSPTGYGLIAKPLSEYNFNLSKVPRVTLIAGDYESEDIIQDKVFKNYNTAEFITEEDVVVENITQNNDIKVFSSADPDIATIDHNGIVTRVSDGAARIIVSGNYLKKGITSNVSLTEAETTSIFDRFKDNTLGKELTDAIDLRIAGKIASVAKSIFTTQNHTTQSYVRNPDCWIYDIDITAISPWNSSGANTRAGVLISPRHIAFATHYQIGVGATVRFVMQDGTVVNKTMTAKTSITSYSTDITIGLLDSDVPEGISFAKVLPDNFTDYIPGIDVGVPIFATDQEEKALIFDLINYPSTTIGYRYPSDATRSQYTETLIGGDSGNPAFMIINDELVLLSTWWYGGSGVGPSITFFKTEINSIMTSLGGEYQLTEIDLSTFESF